MSFISNIVNLLVILLEVIIDIFSFLGTLLVSTLNWILFMIKIPFIISFDLLGGLPFVFQYGLIGLLGLMLTIIALKLFALIKFW
ncbi:MAG: hypothetical protein PHF21_04515 [Bacilli bacterium]|nr:hypothetical protein [Bacilli bacterium]